jgi:hypothetical protein
MGGALIAMMTFRHRHFFNRAHKGVPPNCNGTSHLNLTNKARELFCIAGTLAGVYACSSSALAEIEEDASQEAGKSGYSISALSRDIVTNVLINNVTYDDFANTTLDNSRDDAESVLRNVEALTGGHPGFPSSKGPNGFHDVLVPETVWSLDVNTGAHIDGISGGSDSEIYAVFGRRLEITDFWIRTIFGSSIGNDADRAPNLLAAPPQFQVASCGSSVEHSDLDYCYNSNIIAKQVKNNKAGGSNTSGGSSEQGNSSNVSFSSSASSPDPNPQPANAPFIPATADKLLLQGSLSLLGPCGGDSVSCVTIQIDPPETPIDSAPSFTTPPIDLAPSVITPPIDPINDDLTPPIDLSSSEAPPPGPITYVDNPPSGSDLPPFTPQHLKPIPEASTWVMTLTGFGAMIFLFGRKRRPRINPISIIDVSEVH